MKIDNTEDLPDSGSNSNSNDESVYLMFFFAL